MLIACIVVLAVFIVFVLTTFLMTRKSYSFEFEGKKVRVLNSTNTLKIFVDELLLQTHHMPQLIHGEKFNIKINDKEVELKIKTNSIGSKFSMKAFANEKEIYDNKVTVK